MAGYRTKRGRKGQCFIEAALGGLIIIPVALAMLDLGVLVMTTTLNDAAAKTAARAAANQQNQGLAIGAAGQAMTAFKPTSIASINLVGLTWNTDRVLVKTAAIVHLPVPIPGVSQQTLAAQATEPVVASLQ